MRHVALRANSAGEYDTLYIAESYRDLQDIQVGLINKNLPGRHVLVVVADEKLTEAQKERLKKGSRAEDLQVDYKCIANISAYEALLTVESPTLDPQGVPQSGYGQPIEVKPNLDVDLIENKNSLDLEPSHNLREWLFPKPRALRLPSREEEIDQEIQRLQSYDSGNEEDMSKVINLRRELGLRDRMNEHAKNFSIEEGEKQKKQKFFGRIIKSVAGGIKALVHYGVAMATPLLSVVSVTVFGLGDIVNLWTEITNRSSAQAKTRIGTAAIKAALSITGGVLLLAAALTPVGATAIMLGSLTVGLVGKASATWQANQNYDKAKKEYRVKMDGLIKEVLSLKGEQEILADQIKDLKKIDRLEKNDHMTRDEKNELNMLREKHKELIERHGTVHAACVSKMKENITTLKKLDQAEREKFMIQYAKNIQENHVKRMNRDLANTLYMTAGFVLMGLSVIFPPLLIPGIVIAVASAACPAIGLMESKIFKNSLKLNEVNRGAADIPLLVPRTLVRALCMPLAKACLAPFNKYVLNPEKPLAARIAVGILTAPLTIAGVACNVVQKGVDTVCNAFSYGLSRAASLLTGNKENTEKDGKYAKVNAFKGLSDLWTTTSSAVSHLAKNETVKVQAKDQNFIMKDKNQNEVSHNNKATYKMFEPVNDNNKKNTENNQLTNNSSNQARK